MTRRHASDDSRLVTRVQLGALIAAILFAGCTYQTNAALPEVPPAQPPHPGARQVGVARVADSRSERVSGKLNDQLEVLVGPELDDYIERRFRGELAQRGFAPIEALNPVNNPNPSNSDTIVITVQSVSLGVEGIFFRTIVATIDIAVQVYAPGGHSVLFAQGYQGKGTGSVSASSSASTSAGGVIAVAADSAIDNAVSNAAFVRVLK